MSARDDAERFLRAQAAKPDAAIPIGEAALALAVLDRPEADPARYRDHLTALAAEAGASAGSDSDLAARIHALNSIIASRYGYQGDSENYDDLANANLIRVIERKRGLPVALGILYMHAAQANGWEIAGLNFPGHFVVALNLAGERAIIDPFNGGRLCDDAVLRGLIANRPLRPEFLEAVGTRDVLVRLQNNVKSRHQQAGRHEAALAVVDSMLMFAPERVDLYRERGLIGIETGNLKAAIAALETYIAGVPRGTAQTEAALIARLRARLN